MLEQLNADKTREVIHRIVLEFAPSPTDGPLGDKGLVCDLGYHSLALLELAFALEDEFGLPPMDEEQAQRIKTVQQIEEYVQDVMKNSAG